MNLTRNSIQTAIPSVSLQGTGLIVLFAFVHTISDAVTNMLSALLPTLQNRFGLTGTTLAMLVATLSLSALMTQPLFGALADRVGHRRIAALGVIFNAILFSLIGIVSDVKTLFVLILIGGLGSAALHPAIASMARKAGGNKPEVAVGLFSAGGTLGIAIGPIIIMILLANLGLSFTPWLMIPGILLGTCMFFFVPEDDQRHTDASNRIFDLRLLSGRLGLLALIGMLGNLAFVTFMCAMPLWLVHTHGYSSDAALIGWTLSTFSLSAAAGGIVGGALSNWLGAKRLIVGTLLLAVVPLYSILILTPGTIAYFGAVALAGALVNAGMPMLIVTAQDLAPKAAATASGMLMGFSAGLAGLAYVLIGGLQEILGLAPAMAIGYLSLIAGAVLAMVAIQPRSVDEEKPIEKLSCLCSTCMDQNIAAYPQRMNNS
ncbi:MAG TPA: MFS transporter [Anaerolineales bacterium]|nr:MFS transporter [Anaerolineales bacterium]